jgi:uncharacterized iron-regulated membrane protein
MNWLKVGAVVIGGIIVFFVVDSLVHLFLGLLIAIVFVAIVAGGGYVAFKIAGARRRRRVRRRGEEPRVQRERDRDQERPTIAAPPATRQPLMPRHDVEDELARMKREMGR